MVRRILSALTREIRGLHEAAYVLASFSVLSQVLALVRDRAFAHVFGAGPILDSYFAAFRIPDLIFAFLTLFVSSFALVPLLSGLEKKEQGVLVGNVLFVFGFFAIFVSAVLWYAMPWIVPFMFPGFSADILANTVLLSRIMLLQPVLLGLSSIATSLVQVLRQFVIYALAPILYNIGIIIGAIFLYPILGISGLAWGVVLGALLHLLAQAIPIIGHAKHIRVPTLQSLRASAIEVALPSMPRSLALSAQQILLLAFSGIASVTSVGTVAALSFAFNLQSVPLTVVGISYAAALFPALASLMAKGDREGFAREVWATVRHIVFWTFPAITLLIVLRAHVVRVILGSGHFSWADTRLTAALLALFAVSLIAQSLLLIFSRAYYAAGNTLVPILVNVGGTLTAALAAYAGVQWVEQSEMPRFFLESMFRVSDLGGTSVLMIPLAYSIVLIIAALIFAFLFAREFGYETRVGATFMRSGSASIIAATATYLTLQGLGPLLPTETFLGIFSQGFVAGIVGLMVWVVTLRLMRSDELFEIRTVVIEKLLAIATRLRN